MKLWQMRARRLPVTVRPIGGETIPSYACRLAEANDLRATAILRALGEQHSTGDRYRAPNRDACLNDLAADRLAAFTGIPLTRLAHALPALDADARAVDRYRLPTERPALRYYTPHPHPRPACRLCELHRATSHTPAQALIRSRSHAPLTCSPHRRWLGTWPDHSQYDLTRTRDIASAAARCQRLLDHADDPAWITDLLRQAWNITQEWGKHPPTRPLPATVSRWRARAAALGIPSALHRPIVTFPEAVALAEVLTDLKWRRDLALLDKEWELRAAYEHVARCLGEPLTQPGNRAIAGYRQIWGQQDALTRWIAQHRHRFAKIRKQYQTSQIRSWYSTPPPESRHFR